MCIKSQYLLKGFTKRWRRGGIETGWCPIIVTERAKTAVISLGLIAFALCWPSRWRRWPQWRHRASCSSCSPCWSQNPSQRVHPRSHRGNYAAASKSWLALKISDRKYHQNSTCPYLDDRYTPWSCGYNLAHRLCTPVTQQRQKTFTPPELHLADWW